MKTIKQVADELGVSKDKVKYQVGKLPDIHRVKVGNITYLTDDGLLRILELMAGSLPRNSPGKLPGEENELYKILKDELAAKNALIAEQQQTIRELTDSLKAAQALHAGTIQKQLSDGRGFLSWFRSKKKEEEQHN